ncbi:TetR/AcrR family transcriptional regulator [Lacisediminihabitans profunda]|uniref:TetR/AcrR family transcriptional regulator n=1 Tax=Lacisediminihabitans profunda TaxID=2594790 RepID=A0A5C8UV30_9MICO|nr:TetR/AcrR family transcriptional regulator [Lacisediminihabitans profunda]TXN31872.1 TetR/AcrR family transcriptional regulator [Lacisediminihabitans profunda]
MTAHDPAHRVRKRGRPTASERVERRAQILEAALPIFLEHGYGNVTFDQLATAARVTKRTIYSYFDDKAGVFTAMVRSLATTVSSDAPDQDTLESLCTRIVYRLNSADLIGLHRLVIAESTRFPELAQTLHDNGDARHIARLADHIRAEFGQVAVPRAQPLFTLLLGEEHRKRLLGLLPPVSLAEAEDHARRALALLGLQSSKTTVPTQAE